MYLHTIFFGRMVIFLPRCTTYGFPLSDMLGDIVTKQSHRDISLLSIMSSNTLSRPVRSHGSRSFSKKGCLTCKTRHVKCDEIRPICTACSKRRESCVWSDNPSVLLVLPHAARAALRLSKNRQLSLPTLSEFRPKELELLHNWTTNTIFTFIPSEPAIRHGFQVSLPQIAFQHKFLLHAMFAITSLHMNHLLPSSNYLPLAKMHCQCAVVGALEAQGDSASPDAIIMTSILLATYWLALPTWELTCQGHSPDIFNWVPAVRTIMRMVMPYHENLVGGTFSFLPRRINGLPAEMTPFPDILYRIYDPQACPLDTEELKDVQTLAAYEAALVSFIHYSWGVFMAADIQTLTIHGFICSSPDEFFKLFLGRRPRALILVAHYCALLGQFDRVWWYSWERCRHDLQHILSLLDEEWLPCMEYPLNVLAMKDQHLGDVFDVPFSAGDSSRSEMRNGRNDTLEHQNPFPPELFH
ncbi:hypothetical protein DL96DRAFT_1684452 [Flagelloscypha sp. PMI_526]|nr:hypothetical protein DL96DRAFT_1684452 [Flagelloscypha sp. PMI_526]